MRRITGEARPKLTGRDTENFGSAAYYPTCNNTVVVPKFDRARKESMDLEHGQTTPKFDDPRKEPMELEHEQRSSVDFKKEVGVAMEFDEPSAHASSARIVARVRKRFY